ncbi:MAG: hypothetical protein SNJ67_13870 [Chloracidobacterium sp.]|uniref:Uncharacterized protein n=1 Tax=Chloracidobacterium validum TaxID=2821543 RepID=A0ABX8BEV7_9BACT|nr:hypothetical protein [Chloracidobacterium validum]QUW04153.1 hypothetical protein J8C06_14010 [Chloracidobacterium validum]
MQCGQHFQRICHFVPQTRRALVVRGDQDGDELTPVGTSIIYDARLRLMVSRWTQMFSS